ncbi:MAG: tRNA uridine-5-carboxymethylaminomethyl(34) synthesis GTPase MnmE [Dissulfurimicrobium sp.]|uniref:tRNA uridine-5-carboxymethylaminomethyl(34) synthesis GTPase MnmE n=1 Tax=Dissulfurimicrobium sp. TaxID=2022436 RepID=UPI00404A8426
MSNLFAEEDTIAAIATPAGIGGIGIIRISGPASSDILSKIFRPKKARSAIESHRLYYGHAIDPVDNTVIDEILAVFMKAPNSYTREDTVELQCHGGQAVLRRLLETVTYLGARPAEAGEFTKRAFLNGRIDLTQAEAVLELVQAKTESERSLAAAALEGLLTDQIESIKRTVLQVLSHIEVAIDFSEEEIKPADAAALCTRLSDNALSPLMALIDAYSQRRILREGARIPLIGRPNAGKSSLFNALLGVSRVIVSPIPGTTRDTIEETLEIEGVSVTLIDTAGINQESLDPIETIGVELSMEEIRRADLVVTVFDASLAVTEKDMAVLDMLPHGKPAIIVLNKTDLAKPSSYLEIKDAITNRLSAMNHAAPIVSTSALNASGLNELKSEIIKGLFNGKRKEPGIPGFVPNIRQKNAIEQAAAAVQRACNGLKDRMPEELIAIDLNEAIEKLNGILGIEAGPELLDEIFSRFCIGK